MPYEGYVVIHGKVQGPFKGRDKSAVECHGFDYQVEPPLDVATGHASGKRQHQPVVVTKEWGAASPQLFQALFSNEVLQSVLIEFVDQNAKLPKKKTRRIQLTNAVVSHMSHIGGGKYSVSFVYEEISF